jgi:hypothetical protein
MNERIRFEPCPWSGYAPATGHFCEERECAWVVEPASAASNIGYVLVGLLIVTEAHRRRQSLLRLLGAACVLLGGGSFIYHSTGALFGELADLTGMFIVSSTMIALELRRLVPLSSRRAIVFFAACTAISCALVRVVSPSAILFVVHILALLVILIVGRWKQRAIDHRFLVYVVAAFALALVAWLVDATRWVCDPYNHLISGHVVWHVLTAVALYCHYRFQAQFFPWPGAERESEGTSV